MCVLLCLIRVFHIDPTTNPCLTYATHKKQYRYAFYTVKPITDLALLGREQTEEWKGWMQFIFLLYHYFHAEEVYNSVRVMITCYVWMTGFGNFSFFYIKQVGGGSYLSGLLSVCRWLGCKLDAEWFTIKPLSCSLYHP